MHSKKVSICTLSARNWPFEYMAAALVAQTYTNLEWVFVDYSYEDNYSTVAWWCKNGLDIKHVRPHPVGPYMKDIARNRNLAIKNSTGEYIIFLDDYSVIPSEFVARHMTLLADDVVSCGKMWAQKDNHNDTFLRLQCVTDNLSYRGALARLQANTDCIPDSRSDLLGNPTVAMPCLGPEWTYTGNLGIPRSIIYAAGGFDPRLSSRGEDGDFGIRAAMLGAAIFYNPTAESINLATEGLTLRLQFDHTHHLSFLHKKDHQVCEREDYQQQVNVHVEERYGVKAAICNICGAEYLLNPAEFIYAKKARGEYVVPQKLSGL